MKIIYGLLLSVMIAGCGKPIATEVVKKEPEITKQVEEKHQEVAKEENEIVLTSIASGENSTASVVLDKEKHQYKSIKSVAIASGKGSTAMTSGGNIIIND